MVSIQAPISKGQIREMLRADGKQAARVRGGLIALLAEYTEIPNLPELQMGELVGEILAFEIYTDSLGGTIQDIIAPPPIREPESHRTARRIMDGNFFGMPEVSRVFGALRPEIQAALAVIPFDEAMLRRHSETHVLVADLGLSIIGVRMRMKRGLFDSNEIAWYNSEEFAKRTEQVAWRLIRKTRVPDLMNKSQPRYTQSESWDRQKRLLDDMGAEVPTARRLVYAIMLVFATTGERLFEQVYI